MPAAARAVQRNAADNVVETSRVVLGYNLLMTSVQVVLSCVAAAKGTGKYCDQPLWPWLIVWAVQMAIRIPFICYRFRLARAMRQGTQHWLTCDRWRRRLHLLLMVWIITGQVWFYKSNVCGNSNAWVYDAVKVCIILFYVELGLPLAIVILSCFCFPCIAMFIRFHERYDAPVNHELRTIAERLPEHTYLVQSDVAGASECSICCEPYVSGQTRVCKLECNHEFGAPCIKRWIQANPTCPLCRHPVLHNSVGDLNV